MMKKEKLIRIVGNVFPLNFRMSTQQITFYNLNKNDIFLIHFLHDIYYIIQQFILMMD